MDIDQLLNQPERLIDEKTTSELLGNSVSTLQSDRYNRRGIPFIKVGRLVRYKVKDILEYIEKNRVQTAG